MWLHLFHVEKQARYSSNILNKWRLNSNENFSQLPMMVMFWRNAYITSPYYWSPNCSVLLIPVIIIWQRIYQEVCYGRTTGFRKKLWWTKKASWQIMRTRIILLLR